MNAPSEPPVAELWQAISKEITGIQLLWEAVEEMYFKQPSLKGLACLDQNSPLLLRLMQTAMMESLLMRMSRLMDPAATGRKPCAKPNLSLKRLVEVEKDLPDEFIKIETVWNNSQLRYVRDKYLSHNDLSRSLNEQHTLSIPLRSADIAAMCGLATALRGFRRFVHQKVVGVAYLDETLSLQVRRDIGALNRSLLAGNCFYSLLPSHENLQKAWTELETNKTEGVRPC